MNLTEKRKLVTEGSSDNPTIADIMGRRSDQARSKNHIGTKLAGVDLNLLLVLEALLISRNVTHAARRLGQTQPAVSRSLARLRDVFGDALLVRGSFGLKLTRRGEYLADVVPPTMSTIRDVMSSRQLASEVRVSFNSNLMPAVLPFLLKSPTSENGTLRVNTHMSAPEGLSQLRLKMVDYFVGTLPECGDDIQSEIVFSEDHVTLVGLGKHELGGIRPSEKQFLRLSHIRVMENGIDTFPQFSTALQRLGSSAVKFFEVQDLTAAALMVSDSDLALTVPRSVAGWLTRTMKLSVVLPPMQIPDQVVSLAWLSDEAERENREKIEGIASVVREAVTRDQAAVQLLRPLVHQA